MNQDGSASRQVTKESEAKLADIVVLNSDPLQDLHNTTDIKYVMINGFLYDASSMNQIWPGRYRSVSFSGSAMRLMR